MFRFLIRRKSAEDTPTSDKTPSATDLTASDDLRATSSPKSSVSADPHNRNENRRGDFKKPMQRHVANKKPYQVNSHPRDRATQVNPVARDKAFGGLQISEQVARALAQMEYSQPTPIQTLVVPAMLGGQDVVGQAQTGTGKTASFGIPLAELLNPQNSRTQAIILVPTRELAQQVSVELRNIVRYRDMNVVTLYGGQPINKQFQALEKGAHIIVGTPGRVIDHLERRTINLRSVRFVILDEADQMLDIGFLPDIRRILRQTPRSRQTALFSATLPTAIRSLVHFYLNEPEWIKLGGESEPVAEVTQVYCEVAERDKFRGLLELLDTQLNEQALIFRRTQAGVDQLCSQLKRKGQLAEAIHGAMIQKRRDSVMRDFRNGKLKLLVATNLASRGIDIPAVSNVINYDIPENVEEYVHRIGRTARMGRAGNAVTFVAEWDFETFETIKEHIGEAKLKPHELSIYRKSA